MLFVQSPLLFQTLHLVINGHGVKLSCRTAEECKMEKSKSKIEKSKKVEKKVVVVDELTDEEREAVTIVFHQFETGLREGTILVKVGG